MRPPVIITPGLPSRRGLSRSPSENGCGLRRRISYLSLVIIIAFITIAGQLVRLALEGQTAFTVAISNPIAESFARPDIVDREGRLLAADVVVPSLYADPSLVLDRDTVIEKLSRVLPELDRDALREGLEDRSRRFVWIRRGLSPAQAQEIHDLGLPGLEFRDELRRAYPSGRLAGHVLGSVNIDNKGLSGIELYIDKAIGTEPVVGAGLSGKPPVRLSLDMGVQYALKDELDRSIRRYGAKGAAGLVLDVTNGEVLAASSLPGLDPNVSAELQDPARLDKLQSGTYELGSIFKTMTVAMALEAGLVSLNTELDVTRPLVDGRHTISDPHPAGHPLTVTEVFTHSSNVGAGMLALAAGPQRQRSFLQNLNLLQPMQTEAGPVAAPQLPARWQRIEQITIAFGHGLAIAPLQFAAAAAALVNGGNYVMPTFFHRPPDVEPARKRVISESTSRKINRLLRQNVTDQDGSGQKADVPGYGVGGKTGTAEIARQGGYSDSKVISSFLAAFPMDDPAYLVLVSLFEPAGNAETGGRVTAGSNAAPVAGRLIQRIAPILGVTPRTTLASLSRQ